MIDLISKAISAKRRLAVTYDPGPRVIEPHCLGYGSSGQLLLRAFQTRGASASGEHVNWKLFRLDRMGSVKDADESFDGPRPEYNPDDRVMKGGIISRL